MWRIFWHTFSFYTEKYNRRPSEVKFLSVTELSSSSWSSQPRLLTFMNKHLIIHCLLMLHKRSKHSRMAVKIWIYVIKHYESWIYNNTRLVSFSFVSPGDQSSLRGEESRRSGQGEAACGGGAGGHDQEVPWCLGAAGPHQPGAAEEREVRIDFTICLGT